LATSRFLSYSLCFSSAALTCFAASSLSFLVLPDSAFCFRSAGTSGRAPDALSFASSAAFLSSLACSSARFASASISASVFSSAALASALPAVNTAVGEGCNLAQIEASGREVFPPDVVFLAALASGVSNPAS